MVGSVFRKCLLCAFDSEIFISQACQGVAGLECFPAAPAATDKGAAVSACGNDTEDDKLLLC